MAVYPSKLTITSSIIGAILVASIACFCFGNSNSFAYGIKVGGENIGGLSKEEALEKMKKQIEEFKKQPLTFVYINEQESKKAKITPKKLGINFALEETLTKAFKVDKKSGFWQNQKAKLAALIGKYSFPLKTNIEVKEANQSFQENSNQRFSREKESSSQENPSLAFQIKLDEFLTNNFSQFETLPKNAEIIFNENSLDFEVESSQKGFLFNQQKITKKIKKDTQLLSTSTIYLNLEKTAPEIQTKKAKRVIPKAKKIVEKGDYIVYANGESFRIYSIAVGSWLSFLPAQEEGVKISVNEKSIKNYLIEIQSEINVEPQNPKLNWKDGKLEIISSGEKGEVVDIKKSAKKIKKRILSLDENSDNKIELALKEKKPKITEEKIKDLEIETLVGKGGSNFAGSPENRIHNINVASSKFDGLLVGPGEEFSFNENLGPVGPNQGYLPELVIKEEKTVPEYGGGICQVSTTMFRAAVNSGMNITARTSHAYPVEYYHPQGFDATVYLPSPDLRFVNNTGGYLLIQKEINGYNLSFKFYGKEDNRKVKIEGPYQYDIKESGAMKAKLTQKVWIDGKLEINKTFKSSYESHDLFPVEEKEEDSEDGNNDDGSEKEEDNDNDNANSDG